jgi:hypothetical protein
MIIIIDLSCIMYNNLWMWNKTELTKLNLELNLFYVFDE